MFGPEMADFQKMMQGMMAEMTAHLDPSVMEGLMGNAGVDASGQRRQQVVEDLHKQFDLSTARSLSTAKSLKDEGNRAVKAGRPAEALEKYTTALGRLQGSTASEASELRLQLLSNAAFCHLKLRQFGKAFEASQQALTIDPKSFKALFRRGQARAEVGSLDEAVADVREAARLAPHDKPIAEELARLRALLKKEPELEPCGSSGSSTWEGASEQSSEESSRCSSAVAAEADAEVEPEGERTAWQATDDATADGLELVAKRARVGGGFAILLAVMAVATTPTASRHPRASGYLAGASCAALGAFGWHPAAGR